MAHLFQFYVVRFCLLSLIHCSRLHIGPTYDKVNWKIYFNVQLFVEFYFQGTELLPAELLEKAEMPKVVFIGFGLAGLLCLLLGNAALFAWFIIRRRSKGVFYSIICFRILFDFRPTDSSGPSVCANVNTHLRYLPNEQCNFSTNLFLFSALPSAVVWSLLLFSSSLVKYRLESEQQVCNDRNVRTQLIQ